MRSLLMALAVLFTIGAVDVMAHTPPCCAVAEDGSSCNDNTTTGDTSGAGCINGEAVCAGGDATVPAGCVCVGDVCGNGSGMLSAQQCANAAAAACCAAGQGQDCP